MATTAIGSPSSTAAATGAAGVVTPRMWSVTAAGVGWSKTSVAGSFVPSAAPILLRSSTAVTESTPSSLKARPGGIASTEACPSTSAACRRTSASSAARSRVTSAAASPGSASASAARTSGRSASSGLGRPEVNEGANRSQFMSATAMKVSSAAMTCCNAVSASSGRISSTPRRRSSSPTPPVVMPPFAHAPQAIEVALPPFARRCWASASR